MAGKSFVSIPSCCPAKVRQELAAACGTGTDPSPAGTAACASVLGLPVAPLQGARLIPRLGCSHRSPTAFHLPEVASNLGGPEGLEGNLAIRARARCSRERWPSCCNGALQGHGPAWLLLLTRCLCLWPKAAGLPCCHAWGFWAALLPCTESTRHPAAMDGGFGATPLQCGSVSCCVPPSPDTQPCPWPAPALHAALGFGPEPSPHPRRWWREESPDMLLAQPGANAGHPGLLSTGRTAASSKTCSIPNPPITHLPSPSLLGLIPPWGLHLHLSFPGKLALGTRRPRHPPAPGSAHAPAALAKPAALQRAQHQRGRELCPPSGCWHSTPRHPPCLSHPQGSFGMRNRGAPPCTPRASISLGAPPLSLCRRRRRRVGDVCVPAGARPSTTSAATTMG